MQGKVVSNKMNKTIVVEVERVVAHPMYKKRVRKTKRFLAHAENPVKLGDFVEIEETRPMSKNKRFVVKKVMSEKESKK